MAAVDVEGLTVTYGKVTAVDGISFRAEAGEVTCVLGPNGAGKTSTVEALEGLRRPTSGRLSVIGLDPRTEHGALTTRMGVMLQDGGIHPAVTVRAALRHAAALYENPRDTQELVDRLGLGGLERRTYRQLSGGEQRRLALALALVGRPQVAFLDEPTSGVDPAGRQVIRHVVADLRNEGVTVLLTTHDLDESERIADRVVIIDRGRILAEGTVAELTRAPEDEALVRFRAPVGLDRPDLSIHLGGADVTEVAPGEYVVAAPPDPRTVAAITAWLADRDLALADLRAGRQRLEDVYLRLTGSPPTSDDGADDGPEPLSTPDLASTDPDAPGGSADDSTSSSTASHGVSSAGAPRPDASPSGIPSSGIPSSRTSSPDAAAVASGDEPDRPDGPRPGDPDAPGSGAVDAAGGADHALPKRPGGPGDDDGGGRAVEAPSRIPRPDDEEPA